MPSSGHDADGALDGLRGHEKERAASRYERLEELGRGAMAVVYRARDRQLDRFVALKVLHDDRALGSAVLKRFSREAAAAARLSHPHIVGVHDVGEEAGRPFIVMELVEGRTLAEAFRQWDLRRKVDALRKVALALQHAHEHGVVHRDLKPLNILVDAAGEPRVSDFGLAHLLDSGDALTRTGAQLGTPVYMAPEQALGRVHDVDARSDVWALGIILYEAVTGSVPFIGGTVMEVFHRITSGDPPRAQSLSPKAPLDLETIAFKAMEKEKGRRYATARDFAEELGRWLAGESILARPAGTMTLLLQRARRHRAVIAAVVLAVAAGAGWIAYGRTRPSTVALKAQTERDAKRREASRVLETAKKLYEDAIVSLYNEAAPIEDLAPLVARGVASCDEALAIAADLEEAFYLRGRFRALVGEEAEADFTRAIGQGFALARLERGRLRLERYYDLVEFEPFRRDRERAAVVLAPLRASALADLEAARAAGLGDEEMAYAEALLAVLHDRQDARERCDVFLARSRRKELGHYLLGLHLLRRNGNASEAALSEAIRWRKKWDRAWFQRAMARTSVGRHREAVSDLKRAVALNPRQVVARIALGYYEQIAGRPEAAMTLYEEALTLSPDYPQIQLNMGNVWAERRDYARAIECYERTLRLDGREVRAVLNIALAQHKLENPREAMRQCDVALALDPDSGTAYARRGVAKRDLGDLDGAKADFRRGVEVEPACAEALEELGLASPPVEAIAWLTKALDADPLRHGTRVNRATALCQLRQFDEASKDFEQVLAMAPLHPGALRGRGTLRFERGEFETAIEDLSAYLAREPKDEIGRYMRGAAFVKLARWKEAAADWEVLEEAANGMVRQKVRQLLPEVRKRAGGE